MRSIVQWSHLQLHLPLLGKWISGTRRGTKDNTQFKYMGGHIVERSIVLEKHGRTKHYRSICFPNLALHPSWGRPRVRELGRLNRCAVLLCFHPKECEFSKTSAQFVYHHMTTFSRHSILVTGSVTVTAENVIVRTRISLEAPASMDH